MKRRKELHFVNSLRARLEQWNLSGRVNLPVVNFSVNMFENIRNKDVNK